MGQTNHVRVPADGAAASIQRKQQREASYSHWWQKLSKLVESGDVTGFYREYAAYLESQGIVSRERQMLHKMAKQVAEKESESA